MRVPKQNQVPLEDIAARYNMSPNKVHTIIKTAYNKMVRHLITEKGKDPFDAVMWLRTELGMTEKEAIEKLDERNYNLIKASAEERVDHDEL
jgi:hypothetical protein